MLKAIRAVGVLNFAFHVKSHHVFFKVTPIKRLKMLLSLTKPQALKISITAALNINAPSFLQCRSPPSYIFRRPDQNLATAVITILSCSSHYSCRELFRSRCAYQYGVSWRHCSSNISTRFGHIANRGFLFGFLMGKQKKMCQRMA